MGIATRNLVNDSFLQWLHNEREHVRLGNYNDYDDYYNGEQDVDIPVKVKAALDSELGTVLNYCKLIVDTSVDYIAGGDITVEVPEDLDAEEFLNDIYDKNDLLTVEMMKLVTVMGKKGDVFLKLFIENDEIRVNVLRPDICFPRYRTDSYTDMLYCAVQWWEDEDKFEKTPGKWKAQVFRPDRVDEYEMESDSRFRQDEWTTQSSDWELVKSEENILGFIPIIHLKNTIDDLEFGVSDLQVMTDLQDALNKTITDMLVVMDHQAFQRLYLFGSQSPKGVELSTAPGMITEVSDAGGHIDIVSPSSVEPFVSAMSAIIDHIMTITSTAKVQIMKPDAPLPPSGFALRMHYIPTERKADKKLAVMQSSFRKLNRMILEATRILGKGDFGTPKTRIHFDLGMPVDEISKMQADEGYIRMFVKSPWTVMEENGVEDIPAEMERIDAHREKLRQEEVKLQIEIAEAAAKFQAATRSKPSA